MKIDVHSHFYPSDYLDAVRKFDPEKGSRVTDMEFPIWASADERVEQMSKVGIDVEILSLSVPNVYFPDRALSRELAHMTNEFLAVLCRQYPDRFVGMASLPMLDAGDAVAELRRAVDPLGLKGVVLGSNVDGTYLDAPQFEPVWTEIERLGQPLFIHPMPPTSAPWSTEYMLAATLALPFDTTICVTRMIVAGVFERHPRLSVILPHLGGTLPYLFTRIDLTLKSFTGLRQKASRLPSEYLKEFYYETAIAFGRPTLLCAVELVTPEHLMFGTDYPLGRVERQTVAGIDALKLEPEVNDRIFAGNATSLFQLAIGGRDG